MADAVEESAPAREGRLVRARRARRVRIAVASLLTILILGVIALVAGRWYGATQLAPPPHVVVVGESVLDDGTTTAGVIAVIERRNGALAVRAVDPGEERPVPGTSFHRLRDALAMGGPELVASLATSDIDGDGEPAWLLFEREGWAGVVETAGGARVSLDESATAFTGDTLYRFRPGSALLSGDEATALLLAADSFEDADQGAAVRLALGEVLGAAVIDQPDAVFSAVEGGLAQYSGDTEQLRRFLEQ